MPIKSIASGGGAPPERAPPPGKGSGLSGGPASSPNVVPGFTLPPVSPLLSRSPLPLKQEAPSPIGAPRAAPTSIPSRCAHRTLSPKRLRRPTLCRCAAGRAAARSAAAGRRHQRRVGRALHGPRWPLRNPNDGTSPPSRRWRKAARCAVAFGARELPVRRPRFCADTGLRAMTFAPLRRFSALATSSRTPSASCPLNQEVGASPAFTITRFDGAHPMPITDYCFRWRGASESSRRPARAQVFLAAPRAAPTSCPPSPSPYRFPAPSRSPALAGGPSPIGSLVQHLPRSPSRCAHRTLSRHASARPAALLRGALLSGAKLGAPSAAAACSAAPKLSMQWQRRKPRARSPQTR